MPDLELDAIINRVRAAEELTRLGYPTSKASLATLASRGGGPPYRIYSKTAIYTWREVLEWARARCSAPRRSTSELMK